MSRGDASSTAEFKFVQIGSGDPMWETTPNRAFTVPATETTLPLSYFNNVWEGAPVAVTFQVNMATQQAAGAFVPAEGDFVEVRGAFNGWAGGFTLSPSATNPDIYEGTADVPDAPGARVEYKFVINKATTGAVNWENDPNRGFIQTAEPQALPVIYFNNVTGVPIKTAITFQVDMGVYINLAYSTPMRRKFISEATKSAGKSLHRVSNFSPMLPVPASTPTPIPAMRKSPATSSNTRQPSGIQRT